MGKKGVQAISLYLVLLAVFFIPGGENAHAQGGTVEIKELEETIQLLEDPEVSKRLATQLRGLLNARQQLAEEQAAKRPGRKEVDLVRQFETYGGEVFSQVTRFLSDFRKLPSQARELRDALLKNWRGYLPSALNLFIALLAGFLCWAILYRYTRRFRKRFEMKRSAAFGRQVASLFVSTFFRIYPWVGLWIFCALFFLLFPTHEKIEFMVLRAVLALLFYSGLIHMIRLVLSPEDKENRRVPFHDPLSRYLFLWSRRILLFSFWMYVLTMVASVLDRPGWTRILTSVYWVGWVILLALLLAQWRKGIENVFFMPIQKEDSPWKSHLKRFSNNTAGKIYLILLLYAGLLAALYVFGSVHTYRYLIYSTLKSLGALALLAVLWILWGLLLRRISRAGTALKDPVHGFERHVNRTIGFLGKLGYGGLLLLGFS